MPAARGGGRPHANGFTLVELMIVCSLIGLVTAASGTILWQVSGARQRFDRYERARSEADAAMRAITTAITNAYRAGNEDAGLFVGTDGQANGYDADTLRLLTVSHKAVRPGEPESDVHTVEFRLMEAPDGYGLSLTKRTDPTRNVPDDGGGVVDHIASGLLSLGFEYFDGITWHTRWPESMGRLPAAVRINMILIDQSRPDRTVSRTRVVAIPRVPDTRGGGGE